jgi:EAL domain-containing protein (putative c-di-GMP-specific phosphodiesterase class I)
MIVANRSSTSTLKPMLEQLRRNHFPRSRFIQAGAGVAAADDHHRKFTSVFQPVIRAADGVVGGQQGLLRASDDHGRELGPEDLFESCADRAAVGELDRLARALHAVNYFTRTHDRSQLFMTIDPRLLEDAPDDHRGYFDALLSLLDVPTSRVVVVLPSAALADPVTFVRSTISYTTRGYRLMAILDLADAHADLEHIFLADPSYVGMDATEFSSPQGDIDRTQQVRSIVASLHARGIQAVARRIETERQARVAKDIGFAFLQGRHLARPSLQPAT